MDRKLILFLCLLSSNWIQDGSSLEIVKLKDIRSSESNNDYDALTESGSSNPSGSLFVLREPAKDGRQENIFGPFLAPLNFLLPSTITTDNKAEDNNPVLNQGNSEVNNNNPLGLLQQLSSFQLPSLSSLLTQAAAPAGKDTVEKSPAPVAPVAENTNTNDDVNTPDSDYHAEETPQEKTISFPSITIGDPEKSFGNFGFGDGFNPFASINVNFNASKGETTTTTTTTTEKPHHHYKPHHHNDRSEGEKFCDKQCSDSYGGSDRRRRDGWYKRPGVLVGSSCYCKRDVTDCCDDNGSLCSANDDCDCKSYCSSHFSTNYNGASGYCAHGKCICITNVCDSACQNTKK